MVIYADILIFVNFAVDYFLLRLTAVLLKLRPSVVRTLLGALFGAFTSLYIFLPQSHPITEISVRIIFCLIITLITFGFKDIRRFIRTSALLFGVTFGFAGAMAALWYAAKPPGMVINNSVVYFNISPMLLIVSSAVFYFSASAVKFFFGKKTARAERCEVSLFIGDTSVDLEGIVDTGNGLSDPFTGSAVILVNKEDIQPLFSSHTQMPSRYRALPCGSAAGNALLEGYRTDKAVIRRNGKTAVIKNAVAAISATRIDGHSALLNPDIFEQE